MSADGHRVIIVGFLSQNVTMAVAVAFSMAWADEDGAGDSTDQARGLLAGFRRELYWCLGRRRDALSEVCDALLCRQDREHMLAGLPLPAWPDGRIRLAVDVSNWLRPDAQTSPSSQARRPGPSRR